MWGLTEGLWRRDLLIVAARRLRAARGRWRSGDGRGRGDRRLRRRRRGRRRRADQLYGLAYGSRKRHVMYSSRNSNRHT